MRYVAEHPDATYDEIEAACFPGRDGELALFAISPRHLEACATRTGQVLVEGTYSGALEPGRHYLSVRADLSDLGHVLDEAQDEARRRELTEAAYRGHRRVRPLHVPWRGSSTSTGCCSPARNHAGTRSLRVAGAAGRVHDWVGWRRVWWRIAEGRLLRSAGRLLPRAWRRTPTAEATVVSVTPLALDADSRTLKEAVSLSRTGMRSIVVELKGSTESWADVPIEVISLWPPAGPAVRSHAAEEALPRPLWGALRPLVNAVAPLASLASVNRKTAMALPAGDLYWVHSAVQLPAVAAVARYRCVPFVYDAHDFYSDSKNNEGLRWADRWRMWVFEQVERLFVRFAAKRVTVGMGIKGAAGASLRAVVRGAAQRARPPTRPGVAR